MIPVLHKSMESCSAILHKWFFSAALCWRDFVALPSTLKSSKASLLDVNQGHTWPGHSLNFPFLSFFFCDVRSKFWDRGFAGKFSLLSSFSRLRIIFSFRFWVYKCAVMVPSINVISPTPFALLQSHNNSLPPPCFTVDTMQSWPDLQHAGPHLTVEALCFLCSLSIPFVFLYA